MSWKGIQNGILILSIVIIGCTGSNNTIDLYYGDYSDSNLLMALGANSTIRASETYLEVLDASSAVYTVKEAVTIYDREDRDLADIVLQYDEFISIGYLNVNIYDKNGRKVRSYGLSDARDYSTSNGGTFFSDTRLKVLEPTNNTYPFTVEYEYQQKYNGLLNLPTWRPQTIGQSVESASFTLVDKTGTGVRHYQRNLEVKPDEIIHGDGSHTYTWKVKNLMPVEYETNGPHFSELLPQVLTAPKEFVMESSKGNASSWKDFGMWYYELGKETRELPDEAKKEIDELIAGLESEEEIVHALYDYLQNKTRYVAIQLGIGGWKPFSAEYVFENSYGDCKALTNYMMAALEYAGIKNHAVLIRSGNNTPRMITEFPSNQFNHVVVRVTLANGDEVWLECTSKYLPPDHLGPGNEGKDALLVTSEGGEVVTTPTAAYSENRSNRIFVFDLEESGKASLSGEVENMGVLQDFLLYEILPVSGKEREEWLIENIEADNVKLRTYDFSQVKKSSSSRYSYEAELLDFVNASEKRLYLPVNKMNQFRVTIPEEVDRKHPFFLRYAFEESDSILINMPEDFEVEALPRDVTIINDMGDYITKFELIEDARIIYKRYFSLKNKVVEAEDYPGLKEFFDQVRSADAQQLVLVRKSP